jgi:hypothetical protein
MGESPVDTVLDDRSAKVAEGFSSSAMFQVKIRNLDRDQENLYYED